MKWEAMLLKEYSRQSFGSTFRIYWDCIAMKAARLALKLTQMHLKILSGYSGIGGSN